MTQNYDAIVIGAGPAGSVAARTLAQRGRNVLVLEKGSFPGRKKACGGMLPYQAFADFDISEDVIETKMEGEIFEFPWYRRVTSQPMVTVSRSAFDEHLAMVAKKSGANLVTSCRVTDVIRYASGSIEVKALIKGAKTTFQSHIVIFADGVNSLAYRTASIGFRRRECGLGLGLGLEYAFEAPNNQSKDYFLFFGLKELIRSWGYVWIFPNRDLLNVGIYLPPRELHDHPHTNKMLEHYIDIEDTEFTRLLKGKKIVKKIGAYIPVEVATRFCDDSVMTVGDAAGLVFPFTAGGIGTALHSGKLAGTVSDEALSTDDFSQQFLSRYENKIKNAPFYRDMQRQFQILKFCEHFGRFDSRLFSKLFHLYKLKRELSLLNKLKVAAYPLAGSLNKITPVSTNSK